MEELRPLHTSLSSHPQRAPTTLTVRASCPCTVVCVAGSSSNKNALTEAVPRLNFPSKAFTLTLCT
jgi:hypothetical protein